MNESNSIKGIDKTNLAFIFFLTTGIVRKLLNITRNKKKKHDQILMLAKSKVDSIKNNSTKTIVSQALIDMEISHDEFNVIIREKGKYERMKENVRNVNERGFATNKKI